MLHVYTSMVCFVVVLFFSITGLTLNHPTWTLGDGFEHEASGQLPSDWKSADGEIDWLVVAEHLRSTHDLRGEVSEYDATETDGSMTFKGPGFGADAFIDVETGSYDITIAGQGAVGVLNDLHKGRDSRSSWRWLIDASAILLILISFSGLVLQLFLRRRRRSALWSVVGGLVLVALFTWLAVR